jgi:hypothetical protein
MTDAELIGRFENSSLSSDEFTHARHVRVAWIYLETYSRDEVLERMADGLLRLCARLGKPEKFDYSLTRDWIDRIEAARASHPDARSFEALMAACPHLLDRTIVRGSAS